MRKFSINNGITRVKNALGKIYYKQNVIFDEILDHIVYHNRFAVVVPGATVYTAHAGLIELYKLYLEIGCGRYFVLNEYQNFDKSTISCSLSEDTLCYIVIYRASKYFHECHIRNSFRRELHKSSKEFYADYIDAALERSQHLTYNEIQLLTIVNKLNFYSESGCCDFLRRYNINVRPTPFDDICISGTCLQYLWDSVEIHLTKFPKTYASDIEWDYFINKVSDIKKIGEANDRERKAEEEYIAEEHIEERHGVDCREERICPDLLGCYISPLCDRNKRPVIHLYMDRIDEFAKRRKIDRAYVVLWVYVHEMMHAVLDRYPYLFVKPYIKEIEEPIAEVLSLMLVYKLERYLNATIDDDFHRTRDLLETVIKCVYDYRFVPRVSYYSLAVDMLSCENMGRIISHYYDNIFEIDPQNPDIQKFITDFYCQYPANACDVLKKLNACLGLTN